MRCGKWENCWRSLGFGSTGSKRPIPQLCCFCTGLLAMLTLVGVAFVAFPAIFFGGGTNCPPPANPIAPMPPVNLTFSRLLTTIRLQWTPAANESESGLEYEVQSNRSGTFESEGRDVCGGALSIELDGLPTGRAIAFRLRSVSTIAGRGNWSDIVTTTTLPAAAPQPPTNFSLSFVSDNAVALSWAAPPPAAADAPKYELEVSSGACSATSANWTRMGLEAEDPTATLRHIAHLHARSAYCARVRAANSIGPSAWSPRLDVLTDASNATRPERMEAPAVHSGASTTLGVKWDAADSCGSTIVRYEVQATLAPKTVDDTSSKAAQWRCAAAGADRGCALRDLPAKTRFAVTCRAVNWQGVGDWSAPTVATTGASGTPDAPGVPTPLGGGSLRVNWAPPTDHGSPILAYELQFDDWWRPGNGSGSDHRGPWSTVYSGGATQFDACKLGTGLAQCKGNEEGGDAEALAEVVASDMTARRVLAGYPPPEPQPQGLMPDSRYLMRVRAQNAVGWGGWSAYGTLTPARAGKCGEAKDLGIWHSHLKTLKAELTNSMIKCLLSRNLEECATGKLVDALGLSSSCADCWARDAVCSKANCHMCILHPHGQACEDCAVAKCSPALYACSGVPPWGFPR